MKNEIVLATMKKFFFIFLLLIAGLSFGARLLPHVPNFTPIGALALFVGAYASNPSTRLGAGKYWWSLLIPLLAMFLSDLFIGFYDVKLMAVVYGSFLLYGVVGLAVSRHKTLFNVFLGSIGGAVIFYLTTNFAVWLFGSELVYPHNVQGLLMSYTMALPFFKYTLFGDIFFTGVFLGVYEFASATLLQSFSKNSRKESVRQSLNSSVP